MPEFSVNPTRLDPYKNFKFRVKWDGKYVAGVSRVSALRRSTEVIAHREGGDPSTPHLSPGQTSYDAVTLERGVTHDPEFEAWANAVWKLGGQPESALASFRKDVSLELYNEAGQLVIRYLIHRAWVSEYVALPALMAEGSRSSRSPWRTKAGSAIHPSSSPKNPRATEIVFGRSGCDTLFGRPRTSHLVLASLRRRQAHRLKKERFAADGSASSALCCLRRKC